MKFKSQMEYRITLMRGQKSNNTPCVCEKDYVSNLSTCACKIAKYLKCIIGDSVVICKEIIEVTKSTPVRLCSIKNCFNKNYSNNF